MRYQQNPGDMARERMNDDHAVTAARETMGQQEEQLQAEAEALGEARRDETEDDRRERTNAEAADRLQAVQDELAIEREADGR